MSATTPRFEVRSGSATLVGTRAGEGAPTIVLLHAGVADRRGWDAVASALAGSGTVLSYDRRGFGETRAAPEPHAHADDLARVLDAEAQGAAWLVGSSQGGRVAIDLTLAEPARVAGLVLVSPAVSGAPEPAVYPPAEERLGDLIDVAEEAGDLELVNRYEIHAWLDGPAEPEGRVGGPERDLVLDMNGIALAAADVGEAREPANAFDRIDELTAPTLVIWGDLDLESIRERSERLAARIPGAQGWIVPGTAHLPYLERPVEFAERVRDFIRSAGPPG